MEEDKGPRLKPLLWGGFFIVLGGVLLFQRLFGIDIADWWDLWPVVFLVIGTASLAEGKPGSATTMYAFAFWFFAVTFGWFGMTYRNSWPLAMIAIGIGYVITAISGEDERRRGRRRLRIEHRRAEQERRDEESAQELRTEEPR